MINLILCPHSKLFVLPAILLKRYIEESLGERAEIITGGIALQVLSELEVDCYREEELDKFRDNRSIRLVTVQHNSPGVFRFFERVASRFIASGTNVSVGLWPDGLGNASWGERIDRRFAEYSGREICCDMVFSFGFLHKTTEDLVDGDTSLQLISYQGLSEFMESCTGLVPHVSSLLEEFPKDRKLVVIPFRPWCTESFHGGVYNFGDADARNRVYQDLLEVSSGEGVNPLVIFRGDDRYVNESNETRMVLSRGWEVFDLDAHYPSWLTLEPLIHGMFVSGHANNSAIICLDSTSFQSAPFLANGGGHLAGYLGARTKVLEQIAGGRDFIDSKLRGKVADFYTRYESFFRVASISSLEWIEDDLFRVVT